jgi:hypothetical protein
VNEIINELRRKIEEFEAYRKGLLNELTESDQFKGMWAALFEGVDERIVGISWEQYTPYFNDGEPCTFSVYDPQLVNADGDTLDRNLEVSEDSWFDSYEYTSTERYDSSRGGWVKDTAEELEQSRPVREFYQKVENFIRDLESVGVLEEVFGDHIRVTVMRDGTYFIDDVDHD